ncbi:MAG: formate dehydrogenase subunit delta [Xanthomonadaceae bacterium]|nr:formate dehydrogenase subunit delta [Xanthomonadaceae bacterium]MDE1958017.1 formate dehydrogenase subunit delta [Xanthomonadaceae bacterium]MDE2177939.1 formate dehydrogenase subunit delta [Xanthomonadaceae bacterium]MDE2246619.1 formate dehydrogenase subunit delta [Xanthomonadaceae bacterium]
MKDPVDHLVTMTNDIAHFFAVESDRARAADSVAQHLKQFWDPRMRRRILAHLAAGGAGLEPLAAAGVRRLAELDRVTAA